MFQEATEESASHPPSLDKSSLGSEGSKWCEALSFRVEVVQSTLLPGGNLENERPTRKCLNVRTKNDFWVKNWFFEKVLWSIRKCHQWVRNVLLCPKQQIYGETVAEMHSKQHLFKINSLSVLLNVGSHMKFFKKCPDQSERVSLALETSRSVQYSNSKLDPWPKATWNNTLSKWKTTRAKPTFLVKHRFRQKVLRSIPKCHQWVTNVSQCRKQQF